MHTITAVVLDEHETDTLARIIPLMVLAYPTSDQPPHLRPADVAAVDVRDPRLRIFPLLAEHPYRPITYAQARLAHDAVNRLVEVVEPQADPQWWLDLLQGRTVRDDDRQMAQVMAAERAGQVPRAIAARRLIEDLVGAMQASDDPAYWANIDNDPKD